MPQLIRLTSENELEALGIETLINTTDKVTKVSDESVNRGLIRGNARTAKKALKDIALAVSHLFPDNASDTILDDVADDRGISPRFAAAQSSTYVRIVGSTGTFYQAGVNTISDNKGNVFDLENDVTIGVSGYEYVKVRSQQSGSSTNVASYTLVNINPIPSGHVGVINEYGATGGRDLEKDDEFKQRIKNGPDILARGTLQYLTQAFIKINSNVLRIIYEGVAANGKVVLSILTVNGIDLTSDELNTLLEQGGQYFSLTELNPIGTQSYGVELKNVDYYPIDVAFRFSLFTGASFDDVVISIQQKFQKYVDFRFWNSFEDKVIWTDLLSIVRNTSGVKQVPDNYFSPNLDITIPVNKFPRFRGFIVYDLQGNLLLNNSGTLQNIFYPNQIDAAFSATVI